MVDVRPEPVAREVGALGERQCLVEQRDRGRRARKLVPGDAEPEDDLGAVDVGEDGALGERPRGVEQVDRRADVPLLQPRPGLARAGADVELDRVRRRRPRRARPRRPRWPPCSGTPSTAPRRARAGPRPGCARRSRCRWKGRPDRRSRRCASHSTVSAVGRVLPRSIWLTYSFEKRSPASSVCVRPAATRRRRRRSPSRAPEGAAEAMRWAAVISVMGALVLG